MFLEAAHTVFTTSQKTISETKVNLERNPFSIKIMSVNNNLNVLLFTFLGKAKNNRQIHNYDLCQVVKKRTQMTGVK